MVKLSNPTMASSEDGKKMPVMPVHHLKVIVTSGSFKAGSVVNCFIAKFRSGKFGVMSANFLNYTEHYKVFSENELHETFEEIEVLV